MTRSKLKEKQYRCVWFNLISRGTIKRNICHLFNEKLGIKFSKGDINNTYSSRKTVKIEFLRSINKIQIRQDCKKIKGTGITTVPDLTIIQQKNHTILKKHLKEIMGTSTDRCYIKLKNYTGRW